MNNEFVLQQAFFSPNASRRKRRDHRAQVVRAFEIALNRTPSAKEIEWSLSFLRSQDGYAQRNNESLMRRLCAIFVMRLSI